MSKVKMITKHFTDPNTGEMKPYKRLQLKADVLGRTRILEIKLASPEAYDLAELILESEEELTTHTSTGGEVVVTSDDPDNSDFLNEE